MFSLLFNLHPSSSPSISPTPLTPSVSTLASHLSPSSPSSHTLIPSSFSLIPTPSSFPLTPTPFSLTPPPPSSPLTPARASKRNVSSPPELHHRRSVYTLAGEKLYQSVFHFLFVSALSPTATGRCLPARTRGHAHGRTHTGLRTYIGLRAQVLWILAYSNKNINL